MKYIKDQYSALYCSLLQINDLIKNLNVCIVQLYADDTVIYITHLDTQVTERTLLANMTKRCHKRLAK